MENDRRQCKTKVTDKEQNRKQQNTIVNNRVGNDRLENNKKNRKRQAIAMR